ncbi:hypothetical protein AVEN_125478-1 [Araneus ventricosus]|uniref:Uncharacterized protein n=1 Tax=Araneus ventricosus TaxID=182803 RepID=A0A4Y2KUB8_ARAVE|nr:hypothetical protein AVEN_125478-1 [Araneus ventricosus]
MIAVKNWDVNMCIHLHSIPLVPKLVFSHPFKPINEARHSRTSSRGPNLGRSFDVTLPSQRGPKLASEHEVWDFEFVGIPTLTFRYANFHRFLKLTIAFPF